MIGWQIDQLVGWLVRAVLAVLELLWGLLARTAFTNPDVTVLPQVGAASDRSLLVVNSVFVLAIVAVGVAVMAGRTVPGRDGVGELVSRLVVGFVAANFAMPLCRHLIEFVNAVTAALTGDSVTSGDSFTQMRRVVADALTDPANALLTVIIGLMIAVLTAMLMVTWLVRVAVLVFVVGIAPLALACHATPYTDGVARLWWRALLGVLATAVLQAFAMHTTLSIFVGVDANLPALGIPNDPTGTVNLLIVACLLWVTVRIPALMRRYVMGGHGPGTLLKALVINQVSRVARMPAVRGGARMAAAAGGGRGRRRSRDAAGGSVADTVISYWRPRLPRPALRAARTSAGTTTKPAAPRLPVPAGVTPATAMPSREPGWRRAGRPSPTAQMPGAAGHTAAPGWAGRRPVPVRDRRAPATVRHRSTGGRRGH
ncbi:conjugal transfer protein TrbL family protein [Polymorphospora sp. NPDC050346]|uniref:conjugal transfer protein TrbL family protein n=1 Tax=Polymorphospora sp. NPDC050346 TaxID=3155780 RepID=UPI0033EFA085